MSARCSTRRATPSTVSSHRACHSCTSGSTAARWLKWPRCQWNCSPPRISGRIPVATSTPPTTLAPASSTWRASSSCWPGSPPSIHSSNGSTPTSRPPTGTYATRGGWKPGSASTPGWTGPDWRRNARLAGTSNCTSSCIPSTTSSTPSRNSERCRSGATACRTRQRQQRRTDPHSPLADRGHCRTYSPRQVRDWCSMLRAWPNSSP